MKRGNRKMGMDEDFGSTKERMNGKERKRKRERKNATKIVV